MDWFSVECVAARLVVVDHRYRWPCVHAVLGGPRQLRFAVGSR